MALRQGIGERSVAGWRRARIVLLVLPAVVAAFWLTTPVLAQWPTTCVELNDIVEAHLGNDGNVGIYQRVFGGQAEQACQNDHRDDVRGVFGWAFDQAAPSAASGPQDLAWPTDCVELNDIVENHLGNRGNVGIYQRTFGAQAETACRNDHRQDVRGVFAWAFDGPSATVSSPPTPDLVVLSPTVSNGLTVGSVMFLRATVSNHGTSPAAPTVLRYYRSTDPQITPSDTLLGEGWVRGLAALDSSPELIKLAAPSAPDVYFYGACVVPVPDESDAGNNCSAAVQLETRPSQLFAPPSHLGFGAFYQKYLDAGGIAIVAPAETPDEALFRARDIVNDMLSHAPHVRAAVSRAGYVISMLGEWTDASRAPGLSDIYSRAAGLFSAPWALSREDNVLCYPYSQPSDTTVHEFAHAIHAALPESFDARVQAAYDDAVRVGRWGLTYALTDHAEYWATLVELWFGDKLASGVHDIDSRAELEAHDPAAASLLREVFGGAELSSSCHFARSIKGVVVDADGDPVAGIGVQARIAGDTVYEIVRMPISDSGVFTPGSDITEPDGSFEILVDDRPEHYVLSIFTQKADPHCSAIGWHSPAGLARGPSDARNIYSLSEEEVTVEIRLPAGYEELSFLNEDGDEYECAWPIVDFGGSLAGRVVDAHGQPVAGIGVRAAYPDSSFANYSGYGTAQTKADGSFTIVVPMGWVGSNTFILGIYRDTGRSPHCSTVGWRIHDRLTGDLSEAQGFNVDGPNYDQEYGEVWGLIRGVQIRLPPNFAELPVLDSRGLCH